MSDVCSGIKGILIVDWNVLIKQEIQVVEYVLKCINIVFLYKNLKPRGVYNYVE